MRRRFPALPMAEMYWSMIPQGVPANVCSAFWHRRAFWMPDTEGMFPTAASTNVATATLKIKPFKKLKIKRHEI